MKAAIVGNIAKKYDLICLQKEDMLVEVEELVMLRNISMMETNAIYRLYSGLEALHSKLCGLISLL